MPFVGLILSTFLTCLVSSLDVYEGCGISKGCYGTPLNCELSKNCNALTTYKKSDEDSFEFEVYGALRSLDSGYIAVGLSFDDSMGEDSVAECVQINGKFNLYHSHNDQYYNRRLSDKEQEGFELLESYIENRHMYCRYTRPKVVLVDGVSFDLAENWYILLATGKATEGNIISHFLGGSVSRSSVRINLSQYRTLRSWYGEFSHYEVYSDCGVGKGCFGTPRNCEANHSCKVMMTHRKDGAAGFEFEVMGVLNQPDNSYVAVGLSFDPAMGNDSVTECVYRDQNFKIYHSFNEPTFNNKRLPEMEQIGLQLLDSKLLDGYMYCKFKRDGILMNNGVEFDLMKPWYILLASSTATADNVLSHYGYFADHTDGPVMLGDTGTSTNTATESTIISTLPNESTNLPVTQPQLLEVYNGCGIQKGCFGIPEKCEADQSCDVLMTHKKDDSDGYEFEVLGVLNKPDNSYVAVGLSFDATMGNDSVTECVFLDQSFKLHHSFNEPILDNKRLPESEQTGLDLLDSWVSDGYMYCKFKRDGLQINSGAEFDLSQPWYILLASATATTDNILPHFGYYVAHADEPVLLGDVETTPPTQPNGSTTPPTASTESSLNPVYQDCGDTKGCFGYPSNCVFSQRCEVLVTYRNYSLSQFEFELFGVTTSSKKHKAAGSYIAVGFSEDRRMGNDIVIDCSVIGQKASLAMSLNVGKHNERFLDPQEGLQLLEGREDNGYLYCHLLRESVINYEGEVFNIGETDYHLLLAAGPADTDRIHKHKIKTASQNKVHLNDFGNVMASNLSAMYLWHGILMTVSWMFLVSAATFLPRHHKQSWKDKKICGTAMWFALHRGLMVLAVILTGIAIILIFVAVGGWINSDNPYANAHAIIGLIITALALLQPFGAVFRPSPSHSKRWIFNIIHGGAGYVTFILAVINLLLGTILKNEIEPWAIWIVVAFSGVYLIAQIIHLLFKRSPSKSSSTENMLEISRNQTSSMEVIWYIYLAAALGMTIAIIISLL